MVGVVAMKTLPPANIPVLRPAHRGGHHSTILIPPTRCSARDVSSVPSFTLIDQDANPATSDQLLGHPWVADFIFTTCATPMPHDVRPHGRSANPASRRCEARLIFRRSCSRHPAALKQYGERYHAMPGRWIFLTGDEKSQDAGHPRMKLGFVPAQDGNSHCSTMSISSSSMPRAISAASTIPSFPSGWSTRSRCPPRSNRPAENSR